MKAKGYGEEAIGYFKVTLFPSINRSILEHFLQLLTNLQTCFKVWQHCLVIFTATNLT
jgi:hypothetical protein